MCDLAVLASADCCQTVTHLPTPCQPAPPPWPLNHSAAASLPQGEGNTGDNNVGIGNTGSGNQVPAGFLNSTFATKLAELGLGGLGVHVSGPCSLYNAPACLLLAEQCQCVLPCPVTRAPPPAHCCTYLCTTPLQKLLPLAHSHPGLRISAGRGQYRDEQCRRWQLWEC